MSNDDDILSAILSSDEHLLDDRSNTDGNRAEVSHAEVSTHDLFRNMAPARRCKYGSRCRDRMQCTFYHGDGADLSRQFCSCVDISCPKPHPDRRRAAKRGRIVCNNCGGEHLVTVCPCIKCFKCERYGHFANMCGKIQRL